MSAKLLNLETYLGESKVPAQYQQNRRKTVELLASIQEILGKPLTISSGYRAPAKNASAKGVSSSAHLTASAADFKVNGMTTPEIAEKLLAARSAGKMPAIGEIIFYPFKPGQDVHVTLPGAGGNNEWLFQTHEGGYKLATAATVVTWLNSKTGKATVLGLGLALVLVILFFAMKGGL